MYERSLEVISQSKTLAPEMLTKSGFMVGLGETLEETLSREAPLPLATATAFIEQLADAIGYGHQCGVIHRDIKPGNLIRLKDRPDTIKVLDFGLAKIISSEVDESLVTPHGLTLGTPPYMAPEQLTGGPIGPWTDVYAIGCVAFELLAGRPPFTGSQTDISDGPRFDQA